MRKVCLWNLSEVAIILPMQTGVIYENQTGGVVCYQSEKEGLLIPIEADSGFRGNNDSLSHKLCSYFAHGAGVVGEKEADKIDVYLKSYNETIGISVDRNKLSQSHESWVHIKAIETEFSSYSGFGEIEGILTWPNSD